MVIKVASEPSGVRNTNEVKIIRRMFDSAETDSAASLAMESAAGDTFEFHFTKSKVTDRSIRYLTGELTAALCYLDFTKDISLLDIKTKNFLLIRTLRSDFLISVSRSSPRPRKGDVDRYHLPP
jgi:hypothetical protein